MRPPGHRQSVTALSESTLSLSPSISAGRRPSQRAIDLSRVLPSLLRNPFPLDTEFASCASSIFRASAGTEQATRISFEYTIDALRKLGLDAFVDGTSESGLDFGSGAEARRQLRLWSHSNDEFGVTDEQSFLWIAYRGKRFCDVSQHSKTQTLFQKLSSSGNGMKLSDVDNALKGALANAAEDRTECVDIAELQSVVRELFDYHVGKDGSIDFADFVALTLDTQDRFALAKLSVTRDSPVQCVLRRDGRVTFMRPVSAMDFAASSRTDPEASAHSPRADPMTSPPRDNRMPVETLDPNFAAHSPRIDPMTLPPGDVRMPVKTLDPNFAAHSPYSDPRTLPQRDVRMPVETQDLNFAAHSPRTDPLTLPPRDVRMPVKTPDPNCAAHSPYSDPRTLPSRDARMPVTTQDPNFAAHSFRTDPMTLPPRDSRMPVKTPDPNFGGIRPPVRETRMF